MGSLNILIIMAMITTMAARKLQSCAAEVYCRELPCETLCTDQAEVYCELNEQPGSDFTFYLSGEADSEADDTVVVTIIHTKPSPDFEQLSLTASKSGSRTCGELTLTESGEAGNYGTNRKPWVDDGGYLKYEMCMIPDSKSFSYTYGGAFDVGLKAEFIIRKMAKRQNGGREQTELMMEFSMKAKDNEGCGGDGGPPLEAIIVVVVVIVLVIGFVVYKKCLKKPKSAPPAAV